MPVGGRRVGGPGARAELGKGCAGGQPPSDLSKALGGMRHLFSGFGVGCVHRCEETSPQLLA